MDCYGEGWHGEVLACLLCFCECECKETWIETVLETWMKGSFSANLYVCIYMLFTRIGKSLSPRAGLRWRRERTQRDVIGAWECLSSSLLSRGHYGSYGAVCRLESAGGQIVWCHWRELW